MTIDAVTEITASTLLLILKISLPLLLISLVIGLIISIFQTVTSIQEQTLTFVPKIIGIFLGLILLGGWMLQNMSDFATQLWSDFTRYIH